MEDSKNGGYGVRPKLDPCSDCNLSVKEANLFVLFVCHVEISQTMVPSTMLLVLLESP
jgi:hypothetical protein